MKQIQLKDRVLSFLRKHGVKDHRLLVAVSGGPDSLALLHLLTQCRQEFPLSIHVAHVDHRWRSSSRQEAAELKSLVRSWGLPFYLKTLDPGQAKSEALCREQRYAYFEELALNLRCYTLCLGHQQDDVAETVLKRSCEGAGLIRLVSMKEVSERSSLQLWRPLLAVSKQSLESYCQAHGLPFFIDPSNSSPDYLRARMRQHLLPFCTQQLGKEVRAPLAALAEEASELESYLDERCASYWQHLIKGSWGLCLDLSTECPTHSYEWKHLLRRFCEFIEGAVFSRDQLNEISSALIEAKANCFFENKKVQLYVDRRRLFLLTKKEGKDRSHIKAQDKESRTSLQLGSFYWGSWLVQVEQESEGIFPVTGWRAAWQGKCRWKLPPEIPLQELSLGQANRKLPYGGKRSLDRWWTEQRVPAFFRDCLPVLYQGERLCHEFLGQSPVEIESTQVSATCFITLTKCPE